MPGRYYDVDENGNIIDDRVKDLFQPEEKEEERKNSYSENDSYMERSHSSSPRRYRSRDRYSNNSRREKYDDKPWETPFNPLQLAHYEELYEDKTNSDHSRHKHHRHHHHKHHHHGNNAESEKKRHFRKPEKKTTPADLKDRWGHELYIENVRILINCHFVGCFKSWTRTSSNYKRLWTSKRKMDF